MPRPGQPWSTDLAERRHGGGGGLTGGPPSGGDLVFARGRGRQRAARPRRGRRALRRRPVRRHRGGRPRGGRPGRARGGGSRPAPAPRFGGPFEHDSRTADVGLAAPSSRLPDPDVASAWPSQRGTRSTGPHVLKNCGIPRHVRRGRSPGHRVDQSRVRTSRVVECSYRLLLLCSCRGSTLIFAPWPLA